MTRQEAEYLDYVARELSRIICEMSEEDLLEFRRQKRLRLGYDECADEMLDLDDLA
jgi:hypothetical protein